LLKSCNFTSPRKDEYKTASQEQFIDLTEKKKRQHLNEATLRKLRVRIERGSAVQM